MNLWVAQFEGVNFCQKGTKLMPKVIVVFGKEIYKKRKGPEKRLFPDNEHSFWCLADV